MLEHLLGIEGTQSLPGIDEKQLRNFRETYGPSAFICRYLHCSKATDGFDSRQQRDTHEATHQRKFRCVHPSCAYFHSGFATRGALNKHNEKYHNVVSDRGTLAEAIAAQKQKMVPSTQAPNTVAMSFEMNRPESQPPPEPARPSTPVLTHSKGGVTLNSKGRKKRKDYPSSWGCPTSQMKMKKRVLCVFDGAPSLWKDDMMLDTDYEVRMKLSDGNANVTDLDVQTMRRADAFHNFTEEEKSPWIAGDLTGMDLEKLMEFEAGDKKSAIGSYEK
jgi:hypothetical protein